MAIKKSELYSSLWKSCDALRGGMDASQYKDYVLVLLFMKYVSDKYAGQPDADIEVPPGCSFADMVAVRGDKEIGDKINKIIHNLAKENGLIGVIDQTDFNDPDKLGKGQDMVDRLSNLIAIFNTPALDFRANNAEGDDLLGDAYEYLMRHFATESGKSKGQFYTPAEVSRIMAKVIGVGSATRADQTIYDPTCGSGSLLLKAHAEAKAKTGLDLALYGQEMDNATYALAHMNMHLHGCHTAEIRKDNTLSSPQFKDKNGRLKTFDFAVANPPFSTKAWSTGFDPANDEFGRFQDYPIPPTKNGDYAFLLHLLASLKSTGKGAIILPHGVLFRGNAEGEIRKRIIRYIKGIIGLPANLFYGTTIPACIIVLDKENAAARTGIFMIDASRGLMKDGNKNRLREQDIHKIVDTFTQQFEDDPKYARMVPLAEIAQNDYNLNIPRYIDSSEPEDLQDIEAHLKGGIPVRDIDDLARDWRVFTGVREALFAPADRPGYYQLKVAVSEIKERIYSHPEFAAFNGTVADLFDQWHGGASERLMAISGETRPKLLIETLAESMLTAFDKVQWIDPYDLYQHLMSYWAETMQDDVYLIVGEGWQVAAQPRPLDAGSKEKPDFVVGKRKLKAELIPSALVIARYFAAEQATLTQLESEAEALVANLEELTEEQSGEDGLLAEVLDEKGKVAKATVISRLKVIKRDLGAAEEREFLGEYLNLIDQEAVTRKRVKEVKNALEARVVAKYDELTLKDIQNLVVEAKWLATLNALVQSELDRVSETMSQRVRQLAERYSTPLPQITAENESLSVKVRAHLAAMGVSWL